MTTAALAALLLASAAPVSMLAAQSTAQSAPLSPQEQAAMDQLAREVEQLKPQSGKISIPEGKLELDLGQKYVFYSAADARKILVDIWGNPPEAVEGTLGMVMPAGSSPLSDAWGAIISFEDSGYVSDEDAADSDYNSLLADIQAGQDATNEERVAQGYPAMKLVGWAEHPTYNKGSHSVVWAQDIDVSTEDVNTLNYDVRMLGRYGAVSINFVSTMDKLLEIKAASQQFVTHATFADGARYADFNEATDKVAEYGVGGLVAAGLGLGAAKKLGLLGIILAFGKKGLVLLLPLFAGIAALYRRLFGKKEEDMVWEEDETA